MSKAITLFLACVALAACSGTPYQHIGVGGGYSDKMIAPAKWNVKFIANVANPDGFAQKATFYRAAEISKKAGFPFFQVVDGNVERTLHTYAAGGSAWQARDGGQTARLTIVGARQNSPVAPCEAANSRICGVFNSEEILAELAATMKAKGHLSQ